MIPWIASKLQWRYKKKGSLGSLSHATIWISILNVWFTWDDKLYEVVTDALTYSSLGAPDVICVNPEKYCTPNSFGKITPTTDGAQLENSNHKVVPYWYNPLIVWPSESVLFVKLPNGPFISKPYVERFCATVNAEKCPLLFPVNHS